MRQDQDVYESRNDLIVALDYSQVNIIDFHAIGYFILCLLGGWLHPSQSSHAWLAQGWWLSL